MANEVVLGFFKDEAAADAAVDALKAWDKLDDDVKLSAIGVLTLDEKGKVKIQKLGSRSVTKGAGVGLLLALAVGPLGWGTVIAGGVVGALRHKGLGISAEDRGRIGTNLTNGQAAVGVLARSGEAALVAAKLTELGGTTESHEIAPEVEAEVVAAVPEVEAAIVAADAASEPEAPAQA
jgi:uncharacterized membrane protein